jgi:hypothetical protein
VHDFMTGCPDLAVVDTREGANWIGVLSADPVFARAWSQYHEIAAFDGLEVYRHTVAGCINPWVAGGDTAVHRGMNRVGQYHGG